MIDLWATFSFDLRVPFDVFAPTRLRSIRLNSRFRAHSLALAHSLSRLPRGDCISPTPAVSNEQNVTDGTNAQQDVPTNLDDDIDQPHQGIYDLCARFEDANWKNIQPDVKTVHLIKLLKLLKDSNVMMFFFDKIANWSKDAETAGVCRGTNFLPARKSFLQEFCEMLNMEGLKPKQVPVHLPNAQITLDVTIHDIDHVILSLLTDPSNGRNGENWVCYDENDPFAKPPDTDDNCVCNDINTGT